MTDEAGFIARLKDDHEKTELDIAVAVAWFLSEARGTSQSFSEIVSFIEAAGLRHNVNKTRLRTRLGNCRDVSAPSGKPVSVQPKKAKELRDDSKDFLESPKPKIIEHVLPASLVSSPSALIHRLVYQINTTYQFECYDATATLMRRLMECMIIVAFNKKGARSEILKDGSYLPLDQIIARAGTTTAFHLPRGSQRQMIAIKELGDKGAHSTSYSILKQDIDHILIDFRALISAIGAV